MVDFLFVCLIGDEEVLFVYGTRIKEKRGNGSFGIK